MSSWRWKIGAWSARRACLELAELDASDTQPPAIVSFTWTRRFSHRPPSSRTTSSTSLRISFSSETCRSRTRPSSPAGHTNTRTSRLRSPAAITARSTPTTHLSEVATPLISNRRPRHGNRSRAPPNRASLSSPRRLRLSGTRTMTRTKTNPRGRRLALPCPPRAHDETISHLRPVHPRMTRRTGLERGLFRSPSSGRPIRRLT